MTKQRHYIANKEWAQFCFAALKNQKKNNGRGRFPDVIDSGN